MKFVFYFLLFFVFQKGKRCKLWEDWKAALFFMYMFLQDVETACSFELHLSIHWDCIHLSCTATDRTHGFKEAQYLYKAHPSIVCRYATFSFWTWTGYYLYSVVSLLHVHSLLHMDFLNSKNRHQFEKVQSFVWRSVFPARHQWDLAEHTQSLVFQMKADCVESSLPHCSPPPHIVLNR